MVVPVTMFDIVAGALGRSVLNTKARLMQITPLASQIEGRIRRKPTRSCADPSRFLSYLNNGDQSFFDEFQSYLYLIGIPLSLLGSLIALLTTALNSRKTEARQKKLTRLLMIAEEAQHAEPEQLDRLDDEFRSIVSQCVSELLDGSLGVDQGLSVCDRPRAGANRTPSLEEGCVTIPPRTFQRSPLRRLSRCSSPAARMPQRIPRSARAKARQSGSELEIFSGLLFDRGDA